MHLPRTVLTIALAATTATALPGWRTKTTKEDIKYEKGQGSLTKDVNERQHEPRSERGGGASRSSWQDAEGGMNPMTTTSDHVGGQDHGPYDNGLRVVSNNHGPYTNGLRVSGGPDEEEGEYDENTVFTKPGGDFYQRTGGDKGGNKLSNVQPEPENQFRSGGGKGGSPNYMVEKRNRHSNYNYLKYAKGQQGQGQGQGGHLVPRHYEENVEKGQGQNQGGSGWKNTEGQGGGQPQHQGGVKLTYVKGGAVEPRNFHNMGKLHFEKGGSGGMKQAVGPFGIDHKHLQVRHVENVVVPGSVGGGDEFINGGRTRGDDFVNVKGGDEFVNGGRRTKGDDFVNVKGGDDFVNVKGGDEFVAGPRRNGGETEYIGSGQRGGLRQTEVSHQPSGGIVNPREVEVNDEVNENKYLTGTGKTTGQWKEVSGGKSSGCFELYGKGGKGENGLVSC